MLSSDRNHVERSSARAIPECQANLGALVSHFAVANRAGGLAVLLPVGRVRLVLCAGTSAPLARDAICTRRAIAVNNNK